MNPQSYEHCYSNGQMMDPRPNDSLQSLCWPVVDKSDMPSLQERMASGHPQQAMSDINWPVSEPWRRNVGQPRCQGQGRCQGDAARCNSKYRYGVDDVGRCPSRTSCKGSYSCRNQHVAQGEQCPRPCDKPTTCNRMTTRCFEWPIPQRDLCMASNPNVDHKNSRNDIMDLRIKPECCPTCHRSLVDLQAGPLGINY